MQYPLCRFCRLWWYRVEWRKNWELVLDFPGNNAYAIPVKDECLHGCKKTECGPGQERHYGLADVCTDCPHGLYKNGTNRDWCKLCPRNTTTLHTGSASASQCIPERMQSPFIDIFNVEEDGRHNTFCGWKNNWEQWHGSDKWIGTVKYDVCECKFSIFLINDKT